ncbi:MAG: CoF synthetase [Cellulophaga sp.]|nr:CoF synthetase [Cellulophaga sp.]
MKDLKNKLFWGIDWMKGSPLQKNVQEISACLAITSKATLNNKIQPKLTTLLDVAVENLRYYKNQKNYTSLSDFPVINKSIIKENFNNFVIQPEKPEKIYKVSTSGSTGIPFSIYQSKRKKIRNTADTLYFSKAAGFEIGDRLLYLRLWSAYYKKKEFIAKLQNIQQLDVSDLYDETYIKQLLFKLEKNKHTKGWLGYGSGFETICQYLDKIKSPKLQCNITSSIAIAEYLSPAVKEKMEYYFQCPTVSRYSNVENGIIAQQLPNEDNFTINWASYIVEILDLELDIPAKIGEIGRIVITDLYNHTTPIIRYDTGDIGAFEATETDSVPKLKSIQGRKMDALFATNGSLVNPFIMCSHVYEFPELEQIQYLQLSKNDYTIKVNSKNKFIREAELLSLFKNVVGEEANITIEYVDEIPSLKSGKRKLTVNLSKL